MLLFVISLLTSQLQNGDRVNNGNHGNKTKATGQPVHSGEDRPNIQPPNLKFHKESKYGQGEGQNDDQDLKIDQGQISRHGNKEKKQKEVQQVAPPGGHNKLKPGTDKQGKTVSPSRVKDPVEIVNVVEHQVVPPGGLNAHKKPGEDKHVKTNTFQSYKNVHKKLREDKLIKTKSPLKSGKLQEEQRLQVLPPVGLNRDDVGKSEEKDVMEKAVKRRYGLVNMMEGKKNRRNKVPLKNDNDS